MGGLSASAAVGQAGVQDGLQRMMKAGEQLTQDVSIEAISEMKSAEAQVRASVAVIQTTDEALGHLIDALA